MRKYLYFLALVIIASCSVPRSKKRMPVDAPPKVPLAGMGDHFWKKDTLAVCFLEQSAPSFHNKVMAVASGWSRHGNIHFKQTTDPNLADIKVTLRGNGCWSYLGTEALKYPGDAPTMCLGRLDTVTSIKLFNGVVLHEFGHALGFIHEHQRPDAPMAWDEQQVKCHFSTFTQQEIEQNVLSRYALEGLKYSPFDSLSVMMYDVPPQLVKNKTSAPWNHQLSNTDKLFVSLIYPFGSGF